ncbi:MAG: Fic family protein [Christensenellaceae bacterium]|nr:Fic family protein [Christensenellaceae bacterium]
MGYMSVKEAAEKWGVSERSVRNYCASDRVYGAFLTGKTWNIPKDANKPARQAKPKLVPPTLLEIIREEKESKVQGRIYHKIQIELTYNSNRIEGSKLNHEQTRFIFETNTIGFNEKGINVDDIVETVNHFRCIDLIIEYANYSLSESLIKKLHNTLKSGTSDSRKSWFAVGEYKKLPNEVGGQETALPEEVPVKMRNLLNAYKQKKQKTFDEILDFHYQFEKIHPFQDGNGRIGRLILFKECLRAGIVPFIIDDEHKLFYYRGLREWENEKGFLRDTCLFAQDKFKKYLDYFRIDY